jgi:GNAT superfamily N-acetyltransferase
LNSLDFLPRRRCQAENVGTIISTLGQKQPLGRIPRMADFLGVLRLSAPGTGVLDAGPRAAPRLEPPFAAQPFDIQPFDVERLGDSHARPLIAALVRACAETGGLSGRTLAPAGILAALESSAGRSVVTWTAEARPADAASGPVGLISLVTTAGRHAAERHTIGWLLVHPLARRQGVGRMLVMAAVAAARAAGAREVWIEVHPGWTDAWPFWQSMGFQPR